MHVIFSNEEKKWIDTKKFGWPVKKDCPESIRRSIKRKKELIANQKVV